MSDALTEQIAAHRTQLHVRANDMATHPHDAALHRQSDAMIAALLVKADRADELERRIAEIIEREVDYGRSVKGEAKFQCQAAIDTLNDVLDDSRWTKGDGK